MEKNAEVDVQELTDSYIRRVDSLLEHKELEIMKV
jgi:ribosome recycling factor